MGLKVCMSLQVIKLYQYIIFSPLFTRILLSTNKYRISKSSVFLWAHLHFNRKKWNDRFVLGLRQTCFIMV